MPLRCTSTGFGPTRPWPGMGPNTRYPFGTTSCSAPQPAQRTGRPARLITSPADGRWATLPPFFSTPLRHLSLIRHTAARQDPRAPPFRTVATLVSRSPWCHGLLVVTVSVVSRSPWSHDHVSIAVSLVSRSVLRHGHLGVTVSLVSRSPWCGGLLGVTVTLVSRSPWCHGHLCGMVSSVSRSPWCHAWCHGF